MLTTIKQLNNLLRSSLGEGSPSVPMFMWVKTSEVRGLEKKGLAEHQTQSGIYFMQRTYDPFEWAQLFGDRWVIVMWRYRSEIQWRLQNGDSVPWPRNGEYEMVDGTMLPVGEDPDEKVTRIFIKRMLEHLKKKLDDHKREMIASLYDKKRREDARIDDILDDAALPFINSPQIPGTKGSVSLPTAGYLRR